AWSLMVVGRAVANVHVLEWSLMLARRVKTFCPCSPVLAGRPGARIYFVDARQS
ncbi:hypothetical protein A2U01_0080358, partial [Trifolium medium]|nr:hypothetical protein [Trifolium medium]